jgi:exodeoxyribonuclease VII small subunit
MPDEAYSFAQARARLEEIVTQVRKKDVSLESSLDLLEEGVRLASQCTELIDSADWDTSEAARAEAATPVDASVEAESADEGDEMPGSTGSSDRDDGA